MTQPSVTACDVLVIGGGPGGAATGALLAEAGLEVILLEKDRHPRFHIGESLLPMTLPMLERLGVKERVRAIGVHKPGATFVSADGTKRADFLFKRALRGSPPHAWQVERAKFDQILFDRAVELGVEAHEETTATIIETGGKGTLVEATSSDGTVRHVRAGMLVDSSGRSTITANLRREKTPDPHNTSAAIFGHFHGVPRPDGPTGGNIRIHLTDPGWVWEIPLQDDVTSVGFVAPGAHMAGRQVGAEAFFDAHMARHPALADALADATPAGPIRSTGNFSYRAAAAFAPGHVKVGDAYGFIDPVFSTGVHLALTSATEAVRAILEARARPGRRYATMDRYDRKIRRRLSFVSWFIYRIHDPAFRQMLLGPRNILGVEQAVISLLAGDFRPDPGIRARVALFKALRRMVEWDMARRPQEYGSEGYA